METGEVAAQMSVVQWLMIILLGGVMGTIGQGIRTVVGIKKLNENMAQAGKSLREGFEGATLVVSLLIGFIAGALAAIMLVGDDTVERDLLMGLLAAGYAGTDFIEGFARRYLPGGQASTAGGAPGKPVGPGPAEDDASLPAVG